MHEKSEQPHNYGLILRHLREQNGLSVQKLAKKLGKSSGWLCEIENGSGTSRLAGKRAAASDGSEAVLNIRSATYRIATARGGPGPVSTCQRNGLF